MDVAEEPIDRETYDLISKSLSHPIRRKILRLLSQKGEMHFSDLRDSMVIDGSHLSYHLGQLGELVTKSEDGSYGLSGLGAIAVQLMRDVEESSARLANSGGDKYPTLLDEYKRIYRSKGLAPTSDFSKTAESDLESRIQRKMDYYKITKQEAIEDLYRDTFGVPAKEPMKGMVETSLSKEDAYGRIISSFAERGIRVKRSEQPNHIVAEVGSLSKWSLTNCEPIGDIALDISETKGKSFIAFDFDFRRTYLVYGAQGLVTWLFVMIPLTILLSIGGFSDFAVINLRVSFFVIITLILLNSFTFLPDRISRAEERFIRDVGRFLPSAW